MPYIIHEIIYRPSVADTPASPGRYNFEKDRWEVICPKCGLKTVHATLNGAKEQRQDHLTEH